jgi:hypothetical protein
VFASFGRRVTLGAADRLDEEPPRCIRVPARGEVHVNDLGELLDHDETGIVRSLRSSGKSHAAGSLLGEALLEPVIRVDLIVEGLYLEVTGGAVQRDRFGERFVRLQPNHATASAFSLRLEF